MKRYAIIGLGRFGNILARKLAASGAEVMAIDSEKALIEEIQDTVTLAVRMDATDERALRAQGFDKVDVAVVAIGEKFEATTLVTVLLKQLGVPRVITRATSPIRAKILRLVGADEIISPEEESAQRLAQKLLAPHVIDYLELAEGSKLVQFLAPKAMQKKTIAQIDIRRKYGVNIIALKKRSIIVNEKGEEKVTEKIVDVPQPEDVIEEGDILYIVGKDEKISRLPAD